MKCPICRHGKTRSGSVTVPLERNGMTIVFREIPALVCENCGETFHEEAVTAALPEQAKQAAAAGRGNRRAALRRGGMILHTTEVAPVKDKTGSLDKSQTAKSPGF
jgi:YgiT-type zinc finger domain-containing protein